MTGMTATAIRPPIRETALLTPDATPDDATGTSPRAVVVIGATISVIPSEKTSTPGKTSVQ